MLLLKINEESLARDNTVLTRAQHRSRIHTHIHTHARARICRHMDKYVLDIWEIVTHKRRRRKVDIKVLTRRIATVPIVYKYIDIERHVYIGVSVSAQRTNRSESPGEQMTVAADERSVVFCTNIPPASPPSCVLSRALCLFLAGSFVRATSLPVRRIFHTSPRDTRCALHSPISFPHRASLSRFSSFFSLYASRERTQSFTCGQQKLQSFSGHFLWSSRNLAERSISRGEE